MKSPISFPLRRIFTGLVGAVALAGLAAAAPASAAEVTIPIIVKDTTSNFWQIVLAGARKAGKDLGVKVPELGAQSESDINGQIAILENAVSGKPAAIVISPTQFKAIMFRAAAPVPMLSPPPSRQNTARLRVTWHS